MLVYVEIDKPSRQCIFCNFRYFVLLQTKIFLSRPAALWRVVRYDHNQPAKKSANRNKRWRIHKAWESVPLVLRWSRKKDQDEYGLWGPNGATDVNLQSNRSGWKISFALWNAFWTACNCFKVAMFVSRAEQSFSGVPLMCCDVLLSSCCAVCFDVASPYIPIRLLK